MNFIVRLPRRRLLTYPNGRQQAITDLRLAVGQVRRTAHCQVDGVWGQAWVKALRGNDFLFFLRQRAWASSTISAPNAGRLSSVSRS